MIIDFEIFDIENSNNNNIFITLKPQQLSAVSAVLERNGITNFITNKIKNIPNDFVNISDEQQIKALMNLFANLEDDDDVISFEHNFQK